MRARVGEARRCGHGAAEFGDKRCKGTLIGSEAARGQRARTRECWQVHGLSCSRSGNDPRGKRGHKVHASCNRLRRTCILVAEVQPHLVAPLPLIRTEQRPRSGIGPSADASAPLASNTDCERMRDVGVRAERSWRRDERMCAVKERVFFCRHQRAPRIGWPRPALSEPLHLTPDAERGVGIREDKGQAGVEVRHRTVRQSSAGDRGA